MNKIVIIINGRGGAGKDTFCDISARYYDVTNVSSITPVKNLAELCGWKGEKNDKSRRFLSDLKRLLTEYNDYPNQYLVEQYKEFLKDDKEIMFVHIRECGEIDKFKSNVEVPCITLLIRRSNEEEIPWGNVSDDEVENYKYDYIFDNNGPLKDMEHKFIEFLEKVLEEIGKVR